MASPLLQGRKLRSKITWSLNNEGQSPDPRPRLSDFGPGKTDGLVLIVKNRITVNTSWAYVPSPVLSMCMC